MRWVYICILCDVQQEMDASVKQVDADAMAEIAAFQKLVATRREEVVKLLVDSVLVK